MSDTNGRSPVTVVSSETKYDNSIINRRRVSALVAVVLVAVIAIVCWCLACSLVNWVNSLLSQLFVN